MKKKINAKIQQQLRNSLLKNPILYQPEFCYCKEQKHKISKIKEQVFNLPICNNCNLKMRPKPSDDFYIEVLEQIRFRKAIISKRHREGYGDAPPNKRIDWKKWV